MPKLLRIPDCDIDGFGGALRWAREQRKLSLRNVADQLAVSPSYISDVELGRRSIDPDRLGTIAKMLDVDLGDLERRYLDDWFTSHAAIAGIVRRHWRPR
jgi:transcriptional regulator with XRE-family HTH domain